jgi:N-acetylneuraminic acid mutarotase
VGRLVVVALVAAAVTAGTVLAVSAGDDEDDGAPPPADAARADRWSPLRSAALERTEVGAGRIGRSIYVVGGFERRSGATVAAVERYDIRSGRWSRVRSMPIALNHPAVVAYRGRLYVHGGYRGRRDLSSATNRLFAYDPRRNRWRELPRSPGGPRAAHAIGALGGRLYIAGGNRAGGDIATLEVFDVRRRRWGRGPSFRGPARDHTTGVAAGGFFYVLAGRNGAAGNFRVAERYNPRRRRWERLPSMRRARGGIASAAISRGRVVVFGGEDFNTGRTIAEVELYDPRARRWRRLPDMRTPRHGLGGAALGNRIYAIQGGPRPGFHFSDALEFLDVR